MGDEAPVHHGGMITVAFVVCRACGSIPNHRYFEAVFHEITQVRFHAQVADRSGEDNLLDPAAAQLENGVIG